MAVDNDPEVQSELAMVFVEDCPRMLSDLDKALQARDLGAVEAAAHALKSSLGNFGKTEAFQAAARLEHMAFHGSLADVKRIALSLAEEVQRLSRELAGKAHKASA
ncbi:MAG TPA: Hpt domain-containing protein [Terriglobales bacterium]|jgi:HPt (histidine-containing phosphotransfer) domain-containing protein|nr:Hpt domain-containing protein [Terriglobales bacterium]